MLPKRVDEARWPWSVRFDDAYIPVSVSAITETQVIFTDIMPMKQIPVLHTGAQVCSRIFGNVYATWNVWTKIFSVLWHENPNAADGKSTGYTGQPSDRLPWQLQSIQYNTLTQLITTICGAAADNVNCPKALIQVNVDVNPTMYPKRFVAQSRSGVFAILTSTNVTTHLLLTYVLKSSNTNRFSDTG